MSENTPSRHAGAHRRLRRAKQAIVLAVAGGSAGAWALVASNTVGITASTAVADTSANGAQAQPGSTGAQAGDSQSQGDDGFFGAPNEQPGFFGGFGDGTRHHRTFDGSGSNGSGSGSNGSGSIGGQSGQGGSGGSAGTFGGGTPQSGGLGPMMQSGGS